MYIDTSSLASLIRRDDDYKKDNDPRFSTSRIISIVSHYLTSPYH